MKIRGYIYEEALQLCLRFLAVAAGEKGPAESDAGVGREKGGD